MIGPILDVLTAVGARVSIDAAACVRRTTVLSAQQDCRACASVCPVDAIDLDRLEVATPPCDGCGLCRPVCPPAAVSDRPAVRGDLVAAWQRASDAESFRVTCAAAELPAQDGGVEVGCLASLQWEEVVVPGLLGVRRVELRHACCADCRLGDRVVEALPEMLAVARGVLDAFVTCTVATVEAGARATAFVADSPVPAAVPAARRLSRREVFTRMFRRGRDAAEELGRTAANELAMRVEGEVSAAVVPAGSWLRALVLELLAGHEARVPGNFARGAGVGRPEIDVQRCTLCGVCVLACPTAALLVGEEGREMPAFTVEHGLYLRAGACTGCAACERACPEKAVRLRSVIDPGEWLAGPQRLVAAAEAVCRVCGRPALGPLLPYCATCQREPMSVPRVARDPGER